MQESGVYGEAFGRRLQARATAFVSRSLQKATLAVTELRCDSPQHVLSTPPVREDAYVVALLLRDYPAYEYWEDDRAAPVSALQAGNIIIYDIKRKPMFHLNNPFHSIHFYFPRTVLDAIADNAQAPRVDELRYQPGVCKDDPVMRGLTQALLPAFAHPQEVSRLFADHVMLAAGIHVASAYGGMMVPRSSARGGLAPWQERRVKEILAANLDGDISLTMLADDCNLSTRHFARAFRDSMGVTPHQWLLHRRVEAATALLSNSPLTLSDVAVAAGFANQAHFTRVFSRVVGVTPGAWRRALEM
jgi:AraC family transcriptional regulator